MGVLSVVKHSSIIMPKPFITIMYSQSEDPEVQKRIHKLHDGERNYRSPDVWAEARLWFKHQRDTVPEAASHLVMMASSSLHTPLIKLTTCNTKWALHSELQVHFSHDTPTLLYTTAAAQKRLGASQSCPKLFQTTRHNNCLVTCRTTIASSSVFAPACQQISKHFTLGLIYCVETLNKFPTW